MKNATIIVGALIAINTLANARTSAATYSNCPDDAAELYRGSGNTDIKYQNIKAND